MNRERPDPAENLRLALELFAAGEAMYRQKLRRQHPEWSDSAIEAAVDDWLEGPPPHVPEDATLTHGSRQA